MPSSLADLGSEQYCYLTTIGRVSGQPRTVELWFVEHDGKLYAVSGMPQRTNWVRNLVQSPEVSIRIGKVTLRATARVLESSEKPLWDTVSRLACEKYHEPEPWGTPVEFTVV